jgi:dCMP deaminase
VRDGHEQATIHAEQNAITDCAKRGVSTDGSMAYITHYPCINCMKFLLAAGIVHIFYIHDYKNDNLVPYFSDISKVDVEQI